MIQVPVPSRVRARAYWKQIAQSSFNVGPSTVSSSISPETVVDLTRPTSDFLQVITSRPGRAVINFTDLTAAINSIGSGSSTAPFCNHYKLVFSDGYEHQLAGFQYDFERQMIPGTYTVWVARCLMHRTKYYRDLGVTTPLTFTVSADLSVTTVAPATAVLDTAATFSATPTGGSGSNTVVWTFSDGTRLSGASVQKAFTRPGRYTWSVSVTDSSGGVATDVGGVLVPFAASLPVNMSKTPEVRVS